MINQELTQTYPAIVNLDEVRKLVLDMCYPVGSYFISDNTDDPSIQLGGGVWEKLLGRFLFGTTNPATQPIGSVGGEYEHTLTVNEMPAHKHQQYVDVINVSYAHVYDTAGNVWSSPLFNRDFLNNDRYWNGNQWTMNSNGGNAAHNNMPPYYITNIWKRIG